MPAATMASRLARNEGQVGDAVARHLAMSSAHTCVRVVMFITVKSKAKEKRKLLKGGVSSSDASRRRMIAAARAKKVRRRANAPRRCHFDWR